MAAYISKRQSWLRFAISFILGVCMAALLCSLFRGPQLGFLYDFLLVRRPALPIARDLLVIETTPDRVLEPSAAASLLMTMTELDASALILQTPVLGLSAGNSLGEEEIRFNFDREFDILNRNIRNFFEAIRIGSIAPAQSVQYVNELIELSERGKERLETALVARDEEGLKRLEQAAMVFGNVRRPGDLLVQVIRSGEADRSGTFSDNRDYSRAAADNDGSLRRILPAYFSANENGPEHIIYSTLKSLYRKSEIMQTGTGPVLVLEESSGTVRNLALDINGALLFEIPHRGEDFRRIDMDIFLKYYEADQGLRRLLEESRDQGIFVLLEGEENPVILYDFAQSLQDDLLENPGEIRKQLWKKAREDYFNSLEFFLYGPAEAMLSRDPLLTFSAAGIFADLRKKYGEVMDLRGRLESCLADSFCILGPGRAATGTSVDLNFPPVKPLFPNLSGYISRIKSLIPVSPVKTYTDTEASALLANSIMTGRSIIPGGEFFLFLFAAAAAFLNALVLRSMKVFSGLVTGLFLSFLIGLGFSLGFVYTGIWYDPLVPALAAATVTITLFVWACMLRHGFRKLFRTCYGPNVSSQGLQFLIREGRPRPGDLITQSVAIAAIRNSELVLQEDREQPESAARALLYYREKVSLAFKKAGGLIVNGGDLVIACFGSPPERVILGKNEASLSAFSAHGAPAIRAVGFLAELLMSEESRLWSFGLDTGLCAFTWSPLSGYSIFGRPVIRARLLSSLTERYHSRIIVSGSVNEVLPDLPAKKLGILKERDGSGGEPFYELLL